MNITSALARSYFNWLTRFLLASRSVNRSLEHPRLGEFWRDEFQLANRHRLGSIH